jgi:hypothetical protein
MPRALKRAIHVAIVAAALATSLPCLGEARPLLRVVLAVRGDAPPWFDGFVRHLETELLLRGIDVAVTREGAPRRAPSGQAVPSPDAVLVVEAPVQLRPVLRFAVTAAGASGSAADPLPGRIREVNLHGVPSDGYALALAVAADELMRSNWARAIPAPSAKGAEPPKVDPTKGAAAERDDDPTGAGKGGSAGTPAAATGKGQPGVAAGGAGGAGAAEPRSERGATNDAKPDDTPDPTTSSAASADDADVVRGASRPRAPGPFALGAAASFEAFGGGQTQWGPELRALLRVAPRIEVELRGGFRTLFRQETANGAALGSAIVAGGAVRYLVVGDARASFALVGRADLLSVAYRGEARDPAATDAGKGDALGWFFSAGPSGRIALTPAFRLQGELLAGASPYATTATDASNDAVSTKGAAFGASLGLFWTL